MIPYPAVPRALTIAGSDSGGGAGIQADLATFAAFGLHGVCAVTAVTAQNTLGVQRSLEMPADIVEAQVRSVVADIGVGAVKTGMLSSAAIAALVCDLVQELKLSNLVVDPVMTAKGGYSLLNGDALDLLRHCLLPLATVITPNLDEASALLESPVTSVPEMHEAAKRLRDLGPEWVVVKGGHLPAGDAIDVVFGPAGAYELVVPRHPNPHTHGTGCTFSAAIAAGLAKGIPVPTAIRQAKAFITAAIAGGLAIGHGRGPVDHQPGVRSPWR